MGYVAGAVVDRCLVLVLFMNGRCTSWTDAVRSVLVVPMNELVFTKTHQVFCTSDIFLGGIILVQEIIGIGRSGTVGQVLIGLQFHD